MQGSDLGGKNKQEAMQNITYHTEHLQQVIQGAKAAFYEGEMEALLTRAEFLYQQAGYIRKRWWVLQGLLLIALWILLKYVGLGAYYVQRLLGSAAPLFVILFVPELWKNRTANAMEVEGTAYYSLRQIYAARFMLFGMADILMLFVFSLAAVGSRGIIWEELCFQFFLPLVVSCCICFRTLYSRKNIPEAFSVLLCVVWSELWIQLVLDRRLYETVEAPAWYLALAGSLGYLLYCICIGQRKNCYERG